MVSSSQEIEGCVGEEVKRERRWCPRHCGREEGDEKMFEHLGTCQHYVMGLGKILGKLVACIGKTLAKMTLRRPNKHRLGVSQPKSQGTFFFFAKLRQMFSLLRILI
jgi:hypothetical protein